MFRALDELAMIGITRLLIAGMQRLWQAKRQKQIEVPEELIEQIGRHAHAKNEKSSGKEGGRIVRKLISDVIEVRIQDAATAEAEAYKTCERIVLSPESIEMTDGNVPAPEVAVAFA